MGTENSRLNKLSQMAMYLFVIALSLEILKGVWSNLE